MPSLALVIKPSRLARHVEQWLCTSGVLCRSLLLAGASPCMKVVWSEHVPVPLPLEEALPVAGVSGDSDLNLVKEAGLDGLDQIHIVNDALGAPWSCTLQAIAHVKLSQALCILLLQWDLSIYL